MYLSEQLVEMPETLWGERLFRFLYPIEWHIMIHRGDKGKRAGSSDEGIAVREQTEVLTGITVGEANVLRS